MPKVRKTKADLSTAEPKIKDFLDMIAPGIIKFNTTTSSAGTPTDAFGRFGSTPPPPRNRPSSVILEKKTV